MPFELNEGEQRRYLSELRAFLMRCSRRLGFSSEPFTIECRVEAVQETLAEIGVYLAGTAALPQVDGQEPAISTIVDLTRFAARRLGTNFSRLIAREARAGARVEEDAETWIDAISMASMAAAEAEEHPIYDRRFLLRFLRDVSSDRLALRFASLIIRSHLDKSTRDINFCDNGLIGRLLDCKPNDIRNARYRIETIKNRILSEPDDTGE